MSAALVHRGPDDEGVEVSGEVGLATRRLSVIDLESGHQPMKNETGRIWISFNGEIYNYRELRQGLLEHGHQFRSESDTEVVLHLYEELGPAVVDQLRGMFAFAIWDADRGHLLLARDRFGQKPLYYAWDGAERFVFASEVKSILTSLSSTPELNLGAMDDYLALRFIPSPHTMFQGISKLPPGHTLILDTRGGTGQPRALVERYWSLEYIPKLRISGREAIAEVGRLLEDAVRSHMVSDVPVGAFLSGGMDSSLVVALMATVAKEPVPTFSIGVEEQDFNELDFAAQVAAHVGTQHRAEVVSPGLVELLPRMIFHLEEPSDPVTACMYHASALAARHAKVVLTGDGGDDVFAGFDRYGGFRRIDYYAALPEPIRRLLLGPLLRRLPDRAGYKTLTQKARWAHALAFHRGGRRYAEATLFFRFGKGDKKGLYSDEVVDQLAGRDPSSSIVQAFDSAAAECDLDRMLSADISTRLPEQSLMLTDRMTMMHSLEARSPLLDHELVEFVARLPEKLKIRRGRLKYLLRRVGEPYLPEAILNRPKQGFMFPFGYWMKGPMASVLRRVISQSALVEAGILRREAMTRLLDEHIANRRDHHARLWMLLNLEVWYRMYLTGWNEVPLDWMLGYGAEAPVHR